MMTMSFLFLALVLACLLSSVSGADRIEDEAAGLTRMVLGSKIPENPYSLTSMQKAAATLTTKQSAKDGFHRRTASQLSATHKYVKITPRSDADVEYLQTLDDNSNDEIVLHDHPLDHEVLTEGDYYVQPSYSSSASNFSPVYVVLPIHYLLRSGLSVSVLDYLYEPDDADEEIELQALDDSGLDLESADPVLVRNHHVRERRLTTNQERRLIFGSRYRPAGCVKVWNTNTGAWDPLRQAKISIGRLVWWRYVHTDNNGCFTSPKRYRGTVWIRAKWRSNVATIRTSWNEILGFFVSDGLMTIRRNDNNKTYRIASSDDHKWNKATVHNGLIKYNDYAAAEGISRRVSGANVWVWKNGSDSASTPMLKKFPALGTMASIAGLTSPGFWSSMVNFLFGMLVNYIPSHLRPDMVYSGLKHRKDTQRIEQRVFHESGHYSHAVQAGSWFWSNVFAAEFKNSIATGGPYGDGTDPDVAKGNLIALAEGWATLLEFTIMRKLYNRVWVGYWQTNVPGYIDGFNMNRRPMTRLTSDNDHWFLHGLFWDCIDNGESGGQYRDGGSANTFLNNIDDQVYVNDWREVYPIFRYLTSTTWDACDFGNKLVAGYSSQGQDIEDLFASYGFHCVNAPPAPTPPRPTPRPTPAPTPPRFTPTRPSYPTPKKIVDTEDCGGGVMAMCP